MISKPNNGIKPAIGEGPLAHETRAYPEMAFGGFSRFDGTTQFALRVRSLLKPNSIVLDVGCGRGSRAADPCGIRRDLQDLRGDGRTVIGIDPDPRASVNPYVTQFRVAPDPAHWPVDNATVDLAYSDYVLEHVSDPRAFFAELARVVKSSGFLCIRTPNGLGYPAVAARLMPNRWHARIAAFSQVERSAVDVFPTRYRCNSRLRLKRIAREFGFHGCVYTIEAEPSYLRFSPVLYALAARLHRLLPPLLQSQLLGFFRHQ